MLPGVARVPPPGRGPPGPAPGRGCGRGAGRSTGCWDEKGLLPTRGGRGAPGLGPPCGCGRGPGVGAGPGRAPGVGAGPGRAAGAAGRALAAGVCGCGADGRAGGAAGAGAGAAGGAGGAAATTGAGAAGLGAPGLGPGTGEPGVAPPLGAPPEGRPLVAAGRGALLRSGLPPPNDSRRRRATGASTVDDADLTNSPCSLSRASTCLLVTPSSLANSCTRALPATTSPVWRRQRWVAPRLGFSYDAWSSGLHGVLMFFAACSLAFGYSAVCRALRCSVTAEVSCGPVMRNARANARRRIAASTQSGLGCSHAPRPGRLPVVSTITAVTSVPASFLLNPATTRSSSTANSRFRHPTHVRTGLCFPVNRDSGAFRVSAAEVSRWITAQSTVTPRSL